MLGALKARNTNLHPGRWKNIASIFRAFSAQFFA
jgi:hypothetical protein